MSAMPPSDGRPSRAWIIWSGVAMTVAMAMFLLAWWLVPLVAPLWAITYSPWLEPALRAWNTVVSSDAPIADAQIGMENRLLEWGPQIGPALLLKFERGDTKQRLRIVALGSEVARADGIAAGTTLPPGLRGAFTDDQVQALREDLIKLVMAALADGASYLPSNASYVAMSLRDPRVVPPVCAFLLKQKPPVFEDLEPVIRFLGVMHDPRAVPALIPLLPIRHKAHPVVEESLEACLDDSSVEHVIAATQHAHEVIRTWAALRFPRFATSSVLAERVIALIGDHERQVANAALVAVVQRAPQPSAGPTVQRVASESSDPQIRDFAIRALGELGYAPALPFLRSLLNDEAAWVRLAAISALGDFHRTEDIARLIAQLRNPKDTGVVRQVLTRFVLTPEQQREVDTFVHEPAP